jgi:hypothetical protein
MTGCIDRKGDLSPEHFPSAECITLELMRQQRDRAEYDGTYLPRRFNGRRPDAEP